jgi:tetratricopeptide (TPR) repeat protein
MHYHFRCCFLTVAGLAVGLAGLAQVAVAQGRPGSAPPMPTTQPQPGEGLNQPMNGTAGTSQGWYMSGRVMLDDGTVPPDSVTIKRTCGGVTRPMGYTDSKGRFSFSLKQSPGIVPDASEGQGDSSLSNPNDTSLPPQARPLALGSAPNAQFENCELQAELPGYRSDIVQLGGRRSMDNPDVGTITLHRLQNVEGNSVSATSLEAPKDAKKAYEKGLDVMKKQKWPEAQAQFQKAVGLYPKYASAWFELGKAYEQQANKAQAADAYRKSIQADGKFLEPYFPLSVISLDEKNWTETADVTSTLTRLDPFDYPLAFLFNAIANAQLGHLDDAEKSAREAIKLDKNHQIPRAEYVLGTILADKRDYNDALPLMKSYIERAPNAPDSETVKKQISQVETLAKAQHQ